MLLAAVEPKVVGVNQLPTPSPVPVTVPQTMLPDASVVSALVVLHEPKRPSVVVPVFDTEKSVEVAEAVDEPMAKRVVAVSPLLAAIENLANGELVPIPMLPAVGSLKPVEVAGSVPKTRLPMLSWLLAVVEAK